MWGRSPTLRAFGLLAFVLALASRLALAAVDIGALAETAALLDATLQCQTDAAGRQVPPAAPHHGAGGAVLALASLLSLPAPVLPPSPAVPPPRGEMAVRSAASHSGHAPPPRPPGSALPRGPPVLA